MAGIAEIREADASPEIAETYRLIKEASGVPQLNLIWRHFATEPPVLNWAWTAMADSLRSGAIARTAAQLEDELAPVTDPPVWIDLPDETGTRMADLMAFYTKGNTQNLVGLTALLMWARGETAGSPLQNTAGDQDAVSEAVEPIIPQLPKRDILSADTLRVVDKLAGRHGGAALGVTPSMYLHVALWPEALAAVEARLDATVPTEAFRAETQRIISLGRHHAGGIAAGMSADAPRPTAETLDPMLARLENFVTATIPEMIVVGRLLIGGELGAHR